MATNDEPDDDDLEVPRSMRDIHWATATDEERAEFMEFMRRSIADADAGRVVDAIAFIESLGKEDGDADGAQT